MVNWDMFYGKEEYNRIPLPTYPFDRRSYWIGDGKNKDEAVIKKEYEPKISDDFEVRFQPRPSLSIEYIPPQNEIDKELARIWEELLGIKPIGIIDDFFELGGHSLLATQVLSRIEHKYQIKIPLKEIFYEFNIKKINQILKTSLEI